MKLDPHHRSADRSKQREPILLDGNSLTVNDFNKIIRGAEVGLTEISRERIFRAREIVERASQGNDLIYSINTGFGALSSVKIAPHQLDELQLNFIRSHACSVGQCHPEEESRAILLLRTNVLAKGFSGVRLDLVESLIQMLNRQVHPVIPTKGSVGASGDLSPLAHLASVLIGEGKAFYRGEILPGHEAMKRAGIPTIHLKAKEGLSLVNGTQQMTGVGTLYLLRAEKLADLADLICATSLEGISGSPRAFSDWVVESRPLAGQTTSAQHLRAFMQESEIYQSHLFCDRVQDPYSIRCAPQVHGASRDLISFARHTLSVELNAATDNPLVNIETGEIISGGNFHGQPIAFALDLLGMAVAELGSISERRIVKLINPTFSDLPAFLVQDEGLNSGFMIPQYTAASLVVENRVMTHAASNDSLPTSNEKEDHNSMGPVSARKLKTILENTEYILAIEALTACQALEFRKPLKPGIGPRLLYEAIRERVPPLHKDRYLHPDIENVADLIRTGELNRRLEEAKLI